MEENEKVECGMIGKLRGQTDEQQEKEKLEFQQVYSGYRIEKPILIQNMSIFSFFFISWLCYCATAQNATNQCYTISPSSTSTFPGNSQALSARPLIGDAGIPSLPFLGSIKEIAPKYEEYTIKYNKQKGTNLKSQQFQYRQLVYNKNLGKINQHNKNKNRRHNEDVNEFADLQQTEFISLYAKLAISKQIITIQRDKLNQKAQNKSIKTIASGPILGSAPTSLDPTSSAVLNSFVATLPLDITVDWSCKASPILNQGVCGSCYILVPLENIYMNLRIYNQSAIPLSIQQILACGIPSNGINGCTGGFFNSVFDYIKLNGVGRAIMYPYDIRAINEGFVKPCNTIILESSLYKTSKTFIQSSKLIQYGDCATLVNQLKFGVASISISANGLQFYSNGTFNAISLIANHGVTLVGYDPLNEFKIKNSWGTSWGLSGYGYMSKTSGVCDFAMVPTLGVQNMPMGPCCP